MNKSACLPFFPQTPRAIGYLSWSDRHNNAHFFPFSPLFFLFLIVLPLSELNILDILQMFPPKHARCLWGRIALIIGNVQNLPVLHHPKQNNSSFFLSLKLS